MDDREKFRQLLQEHKLTQAASAALLCAQTGRPCSVRAVRSWLNDRNKPSSRGFPDWAVRELTKALAQRAAASMNGEEVPLVIEQTDAVAKP